MAETAFVVKRMASNNLARLKAKPVPYPNGGALKAMAGRKNQIKENEIKVAEAKHQLELAKINEKHKNANKAAGSK